MRPPTWSFDEHENLHFDNDQDININSENHAESDYALDLDLQTILQ